MPDTPECEVERADQTTLSSALRRYHHHGDQRARERAISLAMPLARRLAVRYFRGREPLDDLVQVAYVGLVTAVDRFDPDRGVAFASFAVPTIMGELRHHFRDCTWAVHVPRSLHDAALDVEAARERLYRRTGHTPSPAALATETGLPLERVIDALRAREINDVKPLDTDPDEDSFSLAERVGKEDNGFELAEHRALLADVVLTLSDREREVLALRFVADLKQSEIAGRVGVSQMQISRVLRRVLETLAEQIRPTADADITPACNESRRARASCAGVAAERRAVELGAGPLSRFPVESVG